MDEFDSLISEINQANTKNISFSCQAYPIIYKLVSTIPIHDIINELGNKVDNHFQDFIVDSNSDKFITPFMRYSRISKEFIRYKKIIRNLFLMIERYTNGSFFLNYEIDQSFIRIFLSLTDFDEILLSFFEKLDTFHFTDFEQNPEFNDLVLVSKLLHFCYYRDTETRQIISDTISKETEKSAQNFMQGMLECNPIDLISSINQYLTTDELLLNKLFYKQNSEESITNIYHTFITLTHPLFEKINSQIIESCKNRDKTFIVDYYKFISFRPPNADILTSLSNTIHDQIKIESIDNITDFGYSISFYNDLFDTMNNSFLTKKYNSQMIEYVNEGKKKIFKDLIGFISKQATSNADISPIRPILGKIESKSEFELIYSRHATRRLVPPTEKQIEREYSIISQIKSSSAISSFDFSNLLRLLKEASQSIEWNIGPVLICNSAVWPFKPPFSKCSYFESIANEISEKFSRLNPSKFLTFPFDSWVVAVKETINNYFISGTAVQAQVFLHLNNHDIVHKDSFSPLISSAQMTSVLKSLSSKKMPILIENQANNEITYYNLNKNFKSKLHIIKLPMPAFVSQAIQKDAIQSKNDQIDAAMTKLMKEKRMMNYLEFESEIIERLSDRFRVTSDEVKSRLNELISREFIEMNEETNCIVYLP